MKFRAFPQAEQQKVSLNTRRETKHKHTRTLPNRQRPREVADAQKAPLPPFLQLQLLSLKMYRAAQYVSRKFCGSWDKFKHPMKCRGYITESNMGGQHNE